MKICTLPGAENEGADAEDSTIEETQREPREALAEDPFGQNFHRMMDAFFSGKHPFFCEEGRAWNPPTDIYETEDALHIKIEVAGLNEEDVEVKVNRDYLVIRGRRVDTDQASTVRFHLMEIHYGSFERIVRLPHPVKTRKISAVLENGFLRVRVPKDITVTEYRIEIE